MSEGKIGHAVPLYPTEGLSRDDWRAGRAEYIGASEVSAVLGLHPKSGPLTVFLRKTEGEPEIDNMFIRRGIRREPLILADASDALTEELGTVVPVDPHPYVLRHPDAKMLACNLDGVATLPGGVQVPVEAKWQGSWARDLWKEYASAGAPPPGSYVECHYVQVQAQLAVTGLPHAYLAGDCDARFYLIKVERDEKLIAVMVEQVQAFWERHIIRGVAPKAEAKDADAIRQLYKSGVEGKTVDLSAFAADVGLLRDLRGQRREIEAQEKDLKAKILAEMTDAQVGLLPDGSKVRMVDVRKQSFDRKSFEAAHPDLAAQFTREITFRQFRP